ncbi:MAG: SDR family oxidoreductase [Rhizobiaceae bacterium]|nr:SDR family oxidoreductase [Rhizobiaceae bacterium]
MADEAMEGCAVKPRVVLVTGGARGIGLDIARRFAAQGHRIAILDKDAPALSAAQQLLASHADGLCGLIGDITASTWAIEAVEEVARQLGPVEILVNSAGGAPNRPFLEISEDEADRIIALNFTSVLNLTRAVLPRMQSARWGRLINISSDAARVGTPREAVYAGAKAGVIGFSKSLCAEVARDGITVNVVCPGTTDTPLLHEVLTPEQIARRAAANPTGRIGQPSDISAVVQFLSSEEAGFINGQVLSVNGGISRVG